jgi:nitrate reductase NapAB chaperone NapD
MWISSFVVTLPESSDASTSIKNAIVAIPVFEVGVAQGRRLPVVLQVDDGHAARHWHEWVTDLPGVVHVEVAFVSFEPDSGEFIDGGSASSLSLIANQDQGVCKYDA